MTEATPGRFQRRFLARALPALAAANIAVSAGYGAVCYWQTRAHILEKQERSVPAIAASAAEPLGSLRFEAIGRLLEGAAADPDVLWAAVSDDLGTEVARIGRPAGEPGAIRLTAPAVMVREHLLERVGSLEVGVSLGRAADAAMSGVIAGLAIALASTLALLAGVVAAARSLVARPLAEIQAGLFRARLDGTRHRLPLTGACDELDGVVADFNEMQERLEADERERAVLSARLDAALTHMAQGIAMYSAEGRLLLSNRRYEDTLGLPRGSLRIGMTFAEALGVAVAHGAVAEADAQTTLARLGNSSKSTLGLPDGRTLSVCHEPLPDGGWVRTFEDITERRRSDERAAFLARHDALTGLPNRSAFGARLETAVAGLGRGHGFAVLCLDLDRFKEVNDTLGHAAGDALLRAVSDRLLSCVRETDVVARLGGDEFAILQTDSPAPDAAAVLARRLIEVAAAPYDLDGHQVVIGVSVGIALAPADGSSGGTLLRNADLALYRAKADGRGTFRYFEASMDAHLRERRQTEADLRVALERGEFELHYQPLVDSGTQHVVGMEALVRWRHAARGLVPPDEFIPLAEETGLLVEIGSWILRRACLDAAAWPGDVRVAVNISPIQFKRPGLLAAVASALADSGLDPRRLELEITETVLLRDSKATLAVLNALRDMRVRIAMDDFGTGYSSLSYLRQFPFDKIKIDRSFVREIGSQPEASAIVRAVAALGSSLGISTTAEGVETEEQLGRIRSDGCSEAQGYLFSKPRPAAEIPELIARINDGASRVSQRTSGSPGNPGLRHHPASCSP